MISHLGSTPCLVTCREMLNTFLLFMLSSLLTCVAIMCTQRRSHCTLPHAEHFKRAQLCNGACPTCGLEVQGLLLQKMLFSHTPSVFIDTERGLGLFRVCAQVDGQDGAQCPVPRVAGGSQESPA